MSVCKRMQVPSEGRKGYKSPLVLNWVVGYSERAIMILTSEPPIISLLFNSIAYNNFLLFGLKYSFLSKVTFSVKSKSTLLMKSDSGVSLWSLSFLSFAPIYSVLWLYLFPACPCPNMSFFVLTVHACSAHEERRQNSTCLLWWLLGGTDILSVADWAWRCWWFSFQGRLILSDCFIRQLPYHQHGILVVVLESKQPIPAKHFCLVWGSW